MLSQLNKSQILKAIYGLIALVCVLAIGMVTRPEANAVTGPQGQGQQVMAPGGAMSGSSTGAASSSAPEPRTYPNGVISGVSYKNDVSIPLRDMKLMPPTQGKMEAPENPFTINSDESAAGQDPIVQNWLAAPLMPAPIMNFNGLGNRNGVYPPDTNGEVGPNHFVQMANLSLQIFNKSGTSVYGPVNGNQIWSGFGGPCETTNAGDPIVLYDQLADRWLLSQFTSSNPYGECIAISTSPDPTGSYYRYFFQLSTTVFYDYPHFGMWPDAYYMSANKFNGGSGAAVIAFNRSLMLLGQPAATYIEKSIASYNLMPSDLDGITPPPAGAPNYVTRFSGTNSLTVYKFHVDWTTPANSTFTSSNLTTATFDSNMCGGDRNCIPQPSTTVKLDAIADRLMFRAAYRNFGTHESLVINHTVDATGADRAGVRWYELRNLNGTPSVFQQSTYSPDADHRWMASVAMDSLGDMALGYSVSNATTVFPSIRYTGRLATDPLNTMPQGESTLVSGSGSQTGSASRWGDYSDMTVDPVDDCTFWFTTEYMPTTGGAPWQTRIGSFKFPGCTAGATSTPTRTATPGSPTVTHTRTNTPTITNTPTRTNTFTVTRTNTITPTPTITNTATRTFTASNTPTSTNTPTRTATNTPTLTFTATNTSTPTNTPLVFDAYAHFVPAGPLTVVVGEKFTLDLWVNTGSSISNAAQHYMTFTNSIIQLVNSAQPGCVLTSTVSPDTTFFDVVLQNETCNGPAPCVFRGTNVTPGSFAYASGALSNPPTQGDFRVAQTAWCGIAVGDATIHWQFSPPDPLERDSEVIDENSNVVSNRALYTDYVIHVVTASPTPTSTSTSTSTPTSTFTRTFTPTNTSTNTPTSTFTNTPTNTFTPSNTATNTPTPTNTPTNTFTSTNTSTRTSTSTSTPTSTLTNTPTNTSTSTFTPTNTPTDTFTPTNTPTDTSTSTSTPTDTPTNTPTDTPTSTFTPTNSPTNTPTNTPTDTPTPNAVQIIGHVTIQGRPAQPNARQSVPITFTLKLAGGGPETDYSTTTDTSGYFTVTAPAAGTYDWRVKNPQTMANSGSVTLSPGVTTQEMGLLKMGDANNDNCVSVQDVAILKNTYGKTVGDPGYDARADFNGDNAVSVIDFNLLKGNFGQCGAGPISPAP